MPAAGTRLAARYLDDDILLSDTHAWTYVRVPLVPYEFRSAAAREDIASRIAVALSQLVTSNQSAVDVHLLVTHRPLDVPGWERDLERRAAPQGPTSGWPGYRSAMSDRLAQIGFSMKEVYLGVCLGPRQGKGSVRSARQSGGILTDLARPLLRIAGMTHNVLGLDDDVVRPAEISEWRERAEDVRRTLRGGALKAVPARSDDVAWLIAKPLWPQPMLQPPATASTERAWGPGSLRQVAEGVVTNHYRWVEIEQPSSHGLQQGYSATLAVSRFPDVLYFPEQEPWMHFAESLLVPASADWSTRMSIVPPLKVQKDVSRKLADAKDQAQHIAEAGTNVPLRVREQLQVATVLEFQIDKDRAPWAYARHRITVTGRTPEEVTARARTLIERYRELNIDLAWPSGDQLDLLLERMPGDKVRCRSYYQRQELAVVAGGMPTASSDVGDQIELGKETQAGWLGPYIGATNWRVLQPVFFSPHVAPVRNKPPGVAITGAPGGGKALALDTPIPTPSGWTTMGELNAGDTVFDDRGQPCQVTHATETMTGHDCYEVAFDDGSTILADSDHRWLTTIPDATIPIDPDLVDALALIDPQDTAAPEDIIAAAPGWIPADAWQAAARWLAANALEQPGPSWPVRAALAAVAGFLATGDPADGHAVRQVRTTREIAAAYDRTGPAGAHAIPVAGPLRLPDTDLADDPGSTGSRFAETPDPIPAAWLRAGTAQRRALLEHLDPHGEGSIAVRSPAQARSLRDLLHGLGYRVPASTGSPDTLAWDRAATRRITSVTPVPSVPVRCITVDSPNRLYLAGEAMIPTHNTFLAFTLAYQMAVQGVWTVYIDPKADAKPMGSIPGLGSPRVFDLRDGNDGMLDPFSMGANRSEATLLALETLRLLLGGTVSGDREEALLDAVQAVGQSERPSLSQVVDHLMGNRASSDARNLGRMLGTIRELPFARLCFAPVGGAALRPEDGLTVVTLLGLDLPNATMRPEDYSYENRLAVSVMYLLTRYARQLMLSLDKNHPKAICIDEAWAIASTPQGAKLIPEIARMGRSHNTALVLVSQNASDLMAEDVTNSISTKFAFQSTIPQEVDAVLKLLGLPDDQGFQASIRNLGNGQCLMQDVDGRVAAIQIDNWNKSLFDAFDTNPETRGKKDGP